MKIDRVFRWVGRRRARVNWLVLALILAGCGKPTPVDSPEADSPEVESPPANTPVVPLILAVPLPSGRNTEMVWVPEGEFWMGSDIDEDEDRPLHSVFLGEFHIDKFEVTDAEY